MFINEGSGDRLYHSDKIKNKNKGTIRKKLLNNFTRLYYFFKQDHQFKSSPESQSDRALLEMKEPYYTIQNRDLLL